MLAHQDAVSATLLQRAARAPRAVTRATRRWSHAAGLTANVAAALRRLNALEGRGVDADPERLHFQRWLAANVCAIHGIEVELRGQVDHLGGERPMVVIANHISYLDPIAILSRLPAFSVAKQEVATWPFVGKLAAQLGMIPYTRGDALSGARVLRRCERRLRAGLSVLVFPEGTTTRGHHVEPFHLGAFHLARRCGVDVLPLLLRYACDDAPWVGEQTFLPHYMRTSMRPRTRVLLEVLDPVKPGAAGSPLAVRDALQRRYASALSQLGPTDLLVQWPGLAASA